MGTEGWAHSPYRGSGEVSAVRGLKPPYEQYFGDPSYDVCAVCGFEFGNDDNPGTNSPVSFEEYLREWVRSGCEVSLDPAKKPQAWQLGEQLVQAGLTA